MKRFLPLFILTGLLFGQDGLILKSGEFYYGTFIGKVNALSINILDELIVFQVEGENDSTKFPINDVAIIKTSNWGELTYPFDIPTNGINEWLKNNFKMCALSLLLFIYTLNNIPM